MPLPALTGCQGGEVRKGGGRETGVGRQALYRQMETGAFAAPAEAPEKILKTMIKKKIEDALNEQINAEMWSAYLYLSMSLHFEHEGRPGIANWFRVQFQEEQAHALALMDYLNARDARVVLQPVAGVPTEWESPKAAFEDTLAHEKKVTALINNLYAMAEAEKDFATRQKLNTFVAEQVEEEDNVRQIIDDLNLVGTDGTGLYQIDRQLAGRTYVAPVL